jgi:hypothetical protein
MKKQVFRIFLMIAGVLTVLVILLSQSFYQPVENGQSKAKANQKAGEQTGATHISAPADVVPSPAIQLADHIPTLLKSFIAGEEHEKTFFPEIEILTAYFNILFRAIISPNAP